VEQLAMSLRGIRSFDADEAKVLAQDVLQGEVIHYLMQDVPNARERLWPLLVRLECLEGGLNFRRLEARRAVSFLREWASPGYRCAHCDKLVVFDPQRAWIPFVCPLCADVHEAWYVGDAIVRRVRESLFRGRTYVCQKCGFETRVTPLQGARVRHNVPGSDEVCDGVIALKWRRIEVIQRTKGIIAFLKRMGDTVDEDAHPLELEIPVEVRRYVRKYAIKLIDRSFMELDLDYSYCLGDCEPTCFGDIMPFAMFV
jgi:predicted RNA-binding Zn-ribbon protein involved in translation (DUF1610 family)